MNYRKEHDNNQDIQGDEVERLRTMMHEQGREIDQLKQVMIRSFTKDKKITQENKDQKKKITQLEERLEEEVNQRKEDHKSFTHTIETERQERIFHDQKITTIVEQDRALSNAMLSNLRDDMMRENEMMRLKL